MQKNDGEGAEERMERMHNRDPSPQPVGMKDNSRRTNPQGKNRGTDADEKRTTDTGTDNKKKRKKSLTGGQNPRTTRDAARGTDNGNQRGGEG